MLTKVKFQKIMFLSLPIIGGALSQNLLNLVDTAMVGRLGDLALASTGLGSFCTFMSQALFMGLSTGVQAMASRRKGEGRIRELAVSLNTGVLISILFAPLLSLILFHYIPSIFPLLNNDTEVIKLGTSYWQIRALAIVFVGINFSYRGFFNGVHLPKVYMMTLIIMHILNIFLNYILIFGHLGFGPMGVKGAAIASAISTLLGSLVYTLLAFYYARDFGFFKKLPSLSDSKSLISLSVPAGLQQLFFAAGFTVFFKIIGLIGTKELAAANILINIILICILPGFGFGMAAATFIGESLGLKKVKDAKQWAYDVSIVGSLISLFIGIIIAIFSTSILKIFTYDLEIIRLARPALLLSSALIWMDVAGIIVMSSLLGAGDSKVVMRISIICQWALFLPIAYFLVTSFSVKFFVVWCLFMIYRLLQSLSFFYVWSQMKWSKIEI